jgi:hypothetical protein
MLTLNQQLSGTPEGIGDQKCVIVLESPSLEEVGSPEAKRRALEEGNKFGFGNAGLSDSPVVAGVNAATDEMLSDEDALKPGTQVDKYRGEFTLSKRL